MTHRDIPLLPAKLPTDRNGGTFVPSSSTGYAARVLQMTGGSAAWAWSVEGPYRVFQAQPLNAGTIDTTGCDALSSSAAATGMQDTADGRYSQKTSAAGSGQVAGLYVGTAHGQFRQVKRGLFRFRTPASLATRAFWIGFVDRANLPPTAAPWPTYTSSHACLRYEPGTDAGWVFSTGDGAGGQNVSAVVGAIAVSTAYFCIIEQTTTSSLWTCYLLSHAADAWSSFGSVTSAANLPAAATTMGPYNRTVSQNAAVTAENWIGRIQAVYL